MAQIIDITPVAPGTTNEMIQEFLENFAGVAEIKMRGGGAEVTLREASESVVEQIIEELNWEELNGKTVTITKSRMMMYNRRNNHGGYDSYR